MCIRLSSSNKLSQSLLSVVSSRPSGIAAPPYVNANASFSVAVRHISAPSWNGNCRRYAQARPISLPACPCQAPLLVVVSCPRHADQHIWPVPLYRRSSLRQRCLQRQRLCHQHPCQDHLAGPWPPVLDVRRFALVLDASDFDCR